MERNVCVAVAQESLLIRYLYTHEDAFAAFHQFMDVEAASYPDIHFRHILPCGYLYVPVVSFGHGHPVAVTLGDPAVVRAVETIGYGILIGRPDHFTSEALGSLYQEELAPVQISLFSPYAVLWIHHRDCGSVSICCFKHPFYHSVRDEGSGSVMDEYQTLV